MIPYIEGKELQGWVVYQVLYCRVCGEQRPCDVYEFAYRCLDCGCVTDFTEGSDEAQ